MIDISQIKFNFYPLKDPHGDLMANMSLVLGKFIIRGFTMRKSKFTNDLYLSPPHRKLGGGKFAKLFWATKDDWQEIEQAAISQFKQTG